MCLWHASESYLKRKKMPEQIASRNKWLNRHSTHINFRFVALVVGNMCLTETAFLLLCTFVDLFYGESSSHAFLWTALIMSGFGYLLLVLGKKKSKKGQKSGRREGMLAVTGTWLTLSLIGMLPFVFGGFTETVADAFFETASGFTTTGATIFKSVEQLPHAILLWRSLIQWQGGIGIVLFTLALPQMSGIGGSSLYNAESTGIKHERFLPRIAEVAQRLWVLYVGITVLLTLLLWAGPMNLFDSLCHALTCVSTGGYTTRNKGILAYNSAYTEYVISIFMFLGSLNMALLYIAVFRRQPKRLLKEEEFRWFFWFVVGFTVIAFIWLLFNHIFSSTEETFRKALFQVVSLISSTGYVTADMNLWHPFFFCIGIMMMGVCGCAGSTTGGLKMSRLMVMIKNLSNEFKKRIHPSMVTNVRFNGKAVDSDVVIQVLAFIFLYLAVIIAGTLALCLTGTDFVSSVADTFCCISNVGATFGAHSSSFASMGAFGKIVMSIIMLAGRLEVFTVIGIFVPSYWRK